MKRTIHKIGVIITIFCLVFPITGLATAHKDIDNAEMDVDVFGASLLSGLRRTGFYIHNAADKTIQDISWTFSIYSIAYDSIEFSYSDTMESLTYMEGFQFLTNAIDDHGFVALTVEVSASKVDDVSKTIKGYQIGPFTFSQTLILSDLF